MQGSKDDFVNKVNRMLYLRGPYSEWINRVRLGKNLKKIVLYCKSGIFIVRINSSLYIVVCITLVPGVVQNLICKAVSSTEMTLEWQEPSQPNGIIEKYVITGDFDEEDKEVSGTSYETQFDSLGR